MKFLGRWLPLVQFDGSENYWRRRYELGGDSGRGSEGRAANYKAAVLNSFVEEHQAVSVIEHGCGDGRQLTLARYPSYLGLDVSLHAIDRCRRTFASRPEMRFELASAYAGEVGDLAVSLDVIYHLVEDEVYFRYLDRLFQSALCYAVIYSTVANVPKRTLTHVRHRSVDQDVTERFPAFARMTDYEAGLPQPVEFGKGGATRFLFYKRVER